MTLPKFENRDVSAAQVRITGAGDGLSEALEVDPVALHLGDDVTYVLKGTVTQVNHRPLSSKHPEIMVRQHTVTASEITEIDGAEPAVVENEASRFAIVGVGVRALVFLRDSIACGVRFSTAG